MNRKDARYVGVFTTYSLGGCLEKGIPDQHITMAYRPDPDKFKEVLPFVGTTQHFEVIGYGNDGKNEGFLVELKSHVPYYGAEQQHITLSVSQDGKPVDTFKLDFNKPIPPEYCIQIGDILEGQVGVFTNNGPVYDAKQFEEFQPKIAREPENADEIKHRLATACYSGDRACICPDEVRSETIAYSVDGGEWTSLDISNPDSLAAFEEYLNDSFSQVDVSIQCLDADFNPNFIPMEFYDVEAAQFNDGNVTIISQGAILSTINFSQEFNEMHFNQEMQFDEKDFDGPDGYDEFDGPIL